MSRAFAPGESDDDEERIVVKAAVLPPGTPNYMTPAGAEALEAERERLIAEKAALSDSVEDRQRAKSLEQQLASLTDRLSQVQVVKLQGQPRDRVRFGARVKIKGGNGEEHTWRIVGVDETDFNKGWISWISPLAKSLLDKHVGESTSAAGQTWTLLKIDYDDPA
jgi:transcription elongation factor GreB